MILPDYDTPITTDDPQEILDYTELLMAEAGLDMRKWEAEMFGGRRSLGLCRWAANGYDPDYVREGWIRISRPWYADLGISGMLKHAPGEFNKCALEDTIRHEIAHALCLERWGISEGRGHGRHWQEMARLVHAKPNACEGTLPQRLMASYKRRCSYCHKVYKWLYQYSSARTDYYCPTCDARPASSTLEIVENKEQVV